MEEKKNGAEPAEEENEIEICPLCPLSSLTKCVGIRCAWYDCRAGCCIIVSQVKVKRK